MDIHRPHDEPMRSLPRGPGMSAGLSLGRVLRREPWRASRAALRLAGAASHALSATLVTLAFLAVLART